MSAVAGLVLAAGAASRFGSPKALAPVDGRPMLEHVLIAARSAGLDPIVVVLGAARDDVERGTRWAGERRIVNPAPARGLASSLQLGIAEVEAVAPLAEGVVVLLADQPRTDPGVIGQLIAALHTFEQPIVAPRYAGGGGANPVLLRRAAFGLVGATRGDRGLGEVIAARPELVHFVEVAGANPDVDTPTDLAHL